MLLNVCMVLGDHVKVCMCERILRVFQMWIGEYTERLICEAPLRERGQGKRS